MQDCFDGVSMEAYRRLDGETDDSGRIERAIADNPGGVVFFPEGRYLFSRPLHIGNHCSLRLAKNAVFKAENRMDYLVEWNGGNENLFHDYTMFISGGVFDGGAMAGGIRLRNVHHFTLENTWIKDCVTGLCVGDRSDFKNYELCASNVYLRNEVGIPGSIGVLVPSHGDHYFDKIIVVDYEIGFSLHTYATYLSKCHSWVTDIIPDMAKTIAFDLRGCGMNVMTDCYADTSHIGLNIVSGSWRINNIFGYHCGNYGGKGHISLVNETKDNVYICGGRFEGAKGCGDVFYAGERRDNLKTMWLEFVNLSGTEGF